MYKKKKQIGRIDLLIYFASPKKILKFMVSCINTYISLYTHSCHIASLASFYKLSKFFIHFFPLFFLSLLFFTNNSNPSKLSTIVCVLLILQYFYFYMLPTSLLYIECFSMTCIDGIGDKNALFLL